MARGDKMCETKCNCENPEMLKGDGFDECTLKQIKECNPEFYEKIVQMWKENYAKK